MDPGSLAAEKRRCVASPLGPLLVTERDGVLVRLRFSAAPGSDDTPTLRAAEQQLTEYFSKQRDVFELPLDPGGSAFQQQVWRALTRIPFGHTVTYGALAKQLDVSDPATIARAVGQACGENPIPIIIPCHRVLSASGTGGFSAPGGVHTKYALLTHEGAALL